MSSRGAIVQYTEEVADEIARIYAGAPYDELCVWVRLAHQREAMVTELYELSQIDDRLSETDETGALVREVILSIWAHEESHTTFLGTLRGASASFAGMAELQGKLEGQVTAWAVNGGMLGRALIAIGGAVGQVPEFARELRRMSLGELVAFHGELETTARMGYHRILELERCLDSRTSHAFGYTFPYDVAKILCEEQFHEDVFKAIASWVAPGGESFQALPRDQCAQRLRELCERHLSIRTVRDTLYPGEAAQFETRASAPSSCASDGGLGDFFASCGITIPLAGGPVL